MATRSLYIIYDLQLVSMMAKKYFSPATSRSWITSRRVAYVSTLAPEVDSTLSCASPDVQFSGRFVQCQKLRGIRSLQTLIAI